MVAIVDGIVGMAGDGPLFGTGVPHGVLAAGADPVAVDTTCARLMGFDPQKVGYLWLAGWAGVGRWIGWRRAARRWRSCSGIMRRRRGAH